MSVRWGWRAVLSSSQSEISFARVKVAIVFLPFLGCRFEGLPALVGFGFTSRIDTRSLSGHEDLLSGSDWVKLSDGRHPKLGFPAMSRGYAQKSVNSRLFIPVWIAVGSSGHAGRSAPATLSAWKCWKSLG